MRVAVVGGGISGLVAAIDARANGFEVTLLDREARPGGKVRSDVLDGHAIDCGPTVLTMRWVFEELFRETGAPLETVLETTRPEVLARHAWGETQLDLFHDMHRTSDAIGRLSGKHDAEAYLTFAERTKRIYETVLGPFLRSQKPTMGSMLLGAARLGISAMHTLDAHRTLFEALRSTFRDPRLVQLFGRYATYTGASPLLAPATLSLIAHVEREGVEVVRGGLAALREALADRARSLGVHFVANAGVTGIVTKRGGVSHVVWPDGELGAEVVLFAGDASALGAGLLGDDVRGAAPQARRDQRSLSAVTFSFLARETGHSTYPLAHHNVFFPHADGGGAGEHATLFAKRDRRMPDDPTVYLCAQDQGPYAFSTTPRPSGVPARFFAILNAPADGDAHPLSEEDVERCKIKMMSRMRASGMTIELTKVLARTPTDFAKAYPGSGGALYGQVSHGSLSALLRPGARTKITGLYLAGGSVHPGAGVPMAALSGRLCVKAILEDHASTVRSYPAATSGSTSTP